MLIFCQLCTWQRLSTILRFSSSLDFVFNCIKKHSFMKSHFSKDSPNSWVNGIFRRSFPPCITQTLSRCLLAVSVSLVSQVGSFHLELVSVWGDKTWLWCPSSASGTHMSVFLSVPYCFNHYASVLYLETLNGNSSCIAFVLFVYLQSFAIPYPF